MPARLNVTIRWTGHALDLPYDMENLEAGLERAIRPAVEQFLGDDLLSFEERAVTVEVTGIAFEDPPSDMPISVRKSQLGKTS